MKLKLLLFTFLGFSQLIFSQEGLPTYQDYLTSSWYLIHPSMAGAAESNQIRLTGRTQWFDVDDAPSLVTASINGRLKENIGGGLLAFNDTNGNFSQNGFYATFAYHLNLSSRQLSLNRIILGASAAVIQRNLDQRSFTRPGSIPDPAISGGVQSETFFNADFGASYLNNDFFLHLTLKNVLPVTKDFLLDDNLEPDNLRRLIGTIGYTFGIGNNGFSLEPSALILNTPEISETLFDLNLKAYKKLGNNLLWGGVSYRASLEGAEFSINNRSIDEQRFQSISPFVGINYKSYVFAYTYTSQLNEIIISDSGFHQITIGYNFGKNKYRGAENRWHCNCPAVNN